MNARVSSADRIRVSHRAEAEVLRYKDDHAMWHKHVHGVDLDPMQILKCIEMDNHHNTIDVSCRRTGKTAVKEMYALKHNACNPYQEVGIVAPRQQQSQTNLTYHVDAIRRSPILRGYIAHKSGREQLSDTKYQFFNGSKASAYGIMSQIDGDAISFASIEEVDDMPADRLLSRFMPMLGSARRLGAPREASFKPQVRITGVFKGADLLQSLIDSKQYHLLPIVNVYLGIELGILNEAFMLEMRAQLPEGEYIRQFLGKNVRAQNHIWEKYIALAKSVGIQAKLEAAGPLPDKRYKKRGLVSFGYDHTGHGESLSASKSALVVAEQMGNFVTFPFVKSWPAGTDDNVIRRDLVGLWRYFMPEYAIGDAYGVGMLTSVNDDLFREGLTHIDRRTIGDGDSNASTWQQWAFAPIRFEGMTKHSMASSLRAVFHNRQAAIPPYDDDGDILGAQVQPNPNWKQELRAEAGDAQEWRTFVRQLGNIKQVPNSSGSYPSYKMVNIKLGDDFFDAACAAVWALTTRGAEHVPTIVSSRTQTREQLLGMR
ncbi:hypothetical protein EDC30_10985 [Paucimonas lemoignei]|uniref:Uncharacterized protein n=1 Tax=Paucimonas lemoignei TaxID=29443 RepID=A0A4R3HRN6_PAULE|nr:phage terminase large subunit family protein [Paucimonas lemoignei]TCS35786.1 hypothetical protein EDC30_10985 [Paucimonas lemoignei]